MIKKGFVLIELLIAIVISSAIAVSLIATIFQINQVNNRINFITSVYTRIAILQNQMERDLMGAFIPAQVNLLPTHATKQEKKITPLEKIFEGNSKGQQFEMLTFISNNPLQTYLPIKNAKPKARVSRVVYRLEPDKKRKNSFVLKRQEGQALSFSKYAKDAKDELRAFSLIEGISDFTITYLKKEIKKGQEGSSPDNQGHYIRSNQWKSVKRSDDVNTITLPEYVEIECVLWDTQFEQKKKFTFTVPIEGVLSWQEPKKQLPPTTPEAQASQGSQQVTQQIVTVNTVKTFDLKNSVMSMSQRLQEVLDT